MYVNLHTRSWFSFLRGASSPENLVRRASQLGMDTLALTDYMSMSGVVEFMKACRTYDIRPIIGAEVALGNDLLLLLTQNRNGYRNVCELITQIRRNPDAVIGETESLRLLKRYSSDVVCLAGGRESLVRSALQHNDGAAAERSLLQLQEVFNERLFVELAHHCQEGEQRLVRGTMRLARDLDIPTAATNAVLYATPEEYDLYDLLTCIRLNRTVYESHPERPRNSEAYLKPLESLLPDTINDPGAFERTRDIAALCRTDLLSSRIHPPAAWTPAATAPADYLRELCAKGLAERIAPEKRVRAKEQLERELEIILELELEEFFLVVHEVAMEARRRNIRYAGRGSAANSIVCFLLYITHVNPIEHNLLFERFLHTGRRGTPDIDVDFDSDKREQIIDWLEERFGARHTAMTATFIRYRLRSALRDTAKALGWPLEIVNDIGKAVPNGDAKNAEEHRVAVEEVIGASPLVDTLLGMAARLDECPRHLGQHSGGMMLTRNPLSDFTPVQPSANEVRTGQHDKEGVEEMGVIKFDVLGLRMLACISEAVELIHRHQGTVLDTNMLDVEDPEVYAFMRTGRTLGLFQIESGGQMHLIAKSQPEHFQDLVTQVAILRPGPVQSGMVHPYIRRRRGLEPVRYIHPDLEPILKDTLGIILFQEQILDIAHRFAGMTLKEADEFRRLMSRFRSHDGMAVMRDRFVDGAVERGVPRATAGQVFENVSYFVGYGFCRSHAAAFAQTVFVSAWLKLNHPAAYMCALMQHRPGMYPQITLEQEARRFGVRTLLPDIHLSGIRFNLERTDRGELAIRKPLTSIRHVSESDARAITMERLNGPFASVEDFYRRVRLSRDTLDALAMAGALDSSAGDTRKALWEVGVLANRLGPAGIEQEAALLEVPAIAPADIPAIPPLTAREQVRWDLTTHSSARVHPVSLVRRQLTDWEVRPIGSLFSITPEVMRTRKPFTVTVGGLVIMRQRPPTARGTCFIILEDESGFVQTVLFANVLERFPRIWRYGALIVRGELQMEGPWRGIVVQHVWPLESVMGGYTGFPGADGGRDRVVLTGEEAEEPGENEHAEQAERRQRVRR